MRSSTHLPSRTDNWQSGSWVSYYSLNFTFNWYSLCCSLLRNKFSCIRVKSALKKKARYDQVLINWLTVRQSIIISSESQPHLPTQAWKRSSQYSNTCTSVSIFMNLNKALFYPILFIYPAQVYWMSGFE